MWWLKRFTDDYFSVQTRSEEDTFRAQARFLEFEDSQLDKLITSRAHPAPTRRKRNASVAGRQTQSSTHTKAEKISRSKLLRTSFGTSQENRDPLTQQLDFDQRLNETILRRAQAKPVTFVPLAKDTAAQRLLDSMRQDSDRMRHAHVQQKPEVVAPDTRRLQDELDDLRRENEVYCTLARQQQSVSAQASQDKETSRFREEVEDLRRENQWLQYQLLTSAHPPLEPAPPPYASPNQSAPPVL
ncbi:hypothetical protein DXG01_014817 [Tephrocybe rancida]|nr:hypothetical protein DXG01_014817 [Tephrocybe rancida]